MSEHPLAEEIDQLLRDMLEGEWDEFKHRRLDEILRDSPEARAQYRLTMQIDALLDPKRLGSVSRPVLSHEILSEVRPTNFRLSAYLGWAVAAMLAMGVLVWVMNQGASEPPNTVAVRTVDSDAVVGHLLDVNWHPGTKRYQVGEPIERDWLQIASGVIQIDFMDGAQMVVEGPAKFRIDSSNTCRVDHGRLTVLAEAQANGFVVEANGSRIVDLGTEFGAEISKDGDMKVYVFDGKVEVATLDKNAQPASKAVLGVREAAVIESNAGVRKTEVDTMRFEALRPKTLWRRRLIRLQLDCGNRSGIYQGIQSPAHAAGDMKGHESFWQLVVADQTGQIQLADGQVSSQTIAIDCGVGNQTMKWSTPLDPPRPWQERTEGVFATPLGQDNINASRHVLVGLRLKGLPAGRYRVYVVARSVLHNTKNDGPSWGNYLTNKASKVSIGIDLNQHVAEPIALLPLKDSKASRWVEGQTHAVQEITVPGPEAHLSILASKDWSLSPRPKGGRSVIQAVQIIQLPQ